MRIKRHKAVRKTLRFFHVNFGFREPYKVLVDGNFVHAVVASGNGDVEATLSKLLMGNVRAFTTRHTLHELQGMGREYRATLEGARRLENESHFFVATQDKDLQRYLSKVPAVPIIFKTVNGVSLQKPGVGLQNYVKRASEAKMGVQDYEKGMVGMGAAREGATVESAEGEAPPGPGLRRKKKARGPNPLSVKKKVKRAPQVQRRAAEGDQQAKPKRKRMRGRGKASAGGENAG